MAGPTAPPGLVRVTVASATRRADLVLPGAVPVAELLPELARSVGLLDPRTAHLGHRLRTTTGALAADAGLLAQGVTDGALLTVVGGVAEAPPPRYDDLAESVRDVVEHDLAHRDEEVVRRTALAAAVPVLVLGALALLAHDDAPRAGAAAAGAAGGLLGGAVLLSRLWAGTGPALAALVAAVVYAGVAGVLLAGQGGVPVLLGGSLGVAGAGLVGLLGLGDGRAWSIPPVLVGLLGAAGVAGEHQVAGRPGAVAAVLLVLVVLGSALLPRLALSLIASDLERARRRPDGSVDLAGLRHDVRAAHEVLLALLVGAGLAVPVLAPVSVSLGAAGTALAVLACLVALLAARRHRVAVEAMAATVLGVAGLLTTAAAAVVLHPHWRPGIAATLLACGAGVLAACVAPGAASVRRGRLGDLAEAAAVLSLLPLLAVASGLSAAVRA